MKKWSLILIFLLSSLRLYAQEIIQGKVLDSHLKPIESVYVYWDSNHPGVVTNSDGIFQIEIPSEVDSLTIDQFEFELKRIAISDLKRNPTIQLIEYVVQLNEALILNKKADEILKDVLNASKVRLNKSLLVNTFYREFISVNNEFTHYSDGLLDYYIKKNSGKSDLYVQQSRNYQVKEKKESEANLSLKVSSPFDIRDALSDAFQFDQINEILKYKKLYDFQIKEFQDNEGKFLRKIEISPKENVKELLVEGSIIYDVETNLILDYKFKAADETLPYSKLYNVLIAKVKINDFNMHFNFRLEEGKYRLVFRRVEFDCYIKFGKKINDDFHFTSDFVVLNYRENENPPSGLGKYKMRNLFEAGTNFKDEYWKSIQGILPTQKEQDLIDSLQKN